VTATAEPLPVDPRLDRVIAFVVLAAGSSVVWLLAQLQPDGRGHGTHEQLGMLPCSWPATLGKPCPTCGVTTASTYVVHLSPLRALQTQPFGAVLAIAGIALALWAGFCLLTGRSFMALLVRLPYGTITLWSLALFLGSWAYTYFTFVP